MTAKILQGCVFQVLPTIKKGSVDIAVSSPPYWGLRSYLDDDHPLKPLELGQEATPEEYIANQVRVLGLVRECLADHGTVWWNVGDTYATGGGAVGKAPGGGAQGEAWLDRGPMTQINRMPIEGIDAGNKCLIPEMLAIALRADGWIVRSMVLWVKPAPMPTSVFGWRWSRCQKKKKSDPLHRPNGPNNRDDQIRANAGRKGQSHGFPPGAEWEECQGCKKCEANGGLVLRRGRWRPTCSYEHIIMLAKNDAAYFCDGDAVKTPASVGTISRDKYTRILDDPGEQYAARHDHETECIDGANLRDNWRTALEAMTKEELIALVESFDDGNMRDIWTIGHEPLPKRKNEVRHYAAFPSELVRRCLEAGTSGKGYCVKCGAPWARVVETKSIPHPNPAAPDLREAVNSKGGNQANGTAGLAPEVKTVGWRATCACACEETRPALVLDPFSGSGRTAITAGRMGLDFVGCELNEEFVKMGQRLVREDNPLFS